MALASALVVSYTVGDEVELRPLTGREFLRSGGFPLEAEAMSEGDEPRIASHEVSV